MVGPRLPEMNVKTDALEQQKRQNGETNPMELLSEINGIVERNQWVCFLKMAFSLAENGKLSTKKQQNAGNGFGMPSVLHE